MSRSAGVAGAEAALAGRRRILFVGCSGAGKSTLARQLGAILDLPVIHLDRHYWQPGWIPLDDDAWDRRLGELLAEPAWIMDGNYHRTFPLRMRFADVVVFLDLPRRVCLARVLRRIASGHGRTRDDLGPGCPEKWDGEFLRWVWHWKRDIRPQLLAALARAPAGLPVITLGTTRHISRFLDGARRIVGERAAGRS